MTKRLYAIRDLKMGSFMPICLYDNDAVATRAFGDLVSKDRESLIGLHPEDFGLYFLGEIDMDSGEIFASKPVSLCLASDFQKGV